MIHEHDVKQRIAAFLRHDISIESFRRWMVDESWNMHQDSSAAAIELVQDVHLLLAEFDDAAISDRIFLDQLASLLDGAARPEIRFSVARSLIVPIRWNINFGPKPTPEPTDVKVTSTGLRDWFIPAFAQL